MSGKVYNNSHSCSSFRVIRVFRGSVWQEAEPRDTRITRSGSHTVCLHTADLWQRALDKLPRISVVTGTKQLAVLRSEKNALARRRDGVTQNHFVRILLRQTFRQRLP